MRRGISHADIVVAIVGLGLAVGCSTDEVLIGEQCLSPFSGRATLAAPDAGPAVVYGTSCAPCDGTGVRLDARGCPIFVTFESCGGDICIGDGRVSAVLEGDDDAGADDDGGASEGDSGAR